MGHFDFPKFSQIATKVGVYFLQENTKLEGKIFKVPELEKCWEYKINRSTRIKTLYATQDKIHNLFIDHHLSKTLNTNISWSF